MVGFLGGGFAQGMMDERERLSGERLRVARAFDDFKRNNPYATLQEFQSFADQVSGGDSYLRGRFPTDEVMQRLADDNQRRRALDEADRQAQVLDREVRVDESLQRAFRENVRNSGDPMRSLEETLNAFARDPASREVLRGRMMARIGDPSAYVRRIQADDINEALPNIVRAVNSGIDISEAVQHLPQGVRDQVAQRARQQVERERSESARRTRQEDAQRMVGFETAMIQRFGPLMLDPNNQDLVRRQITEAAQTFGVNLDQPGVDRILGAVRASQDAAVFSINQNMSQAQRLRGAEVADREISTYQGSITRSGAARFTSQNDPRRTVAEIIGQRFFLSPDQQDAALNWLQQNAPSSGNIPTEDWARRAAQAVSGERPVPLVEYRQRRSNELGGGVLPPPVQYGVWSGRTQREITRIMDAYRTSIERAASSGNRDEAAAIEREASGLLTGILRDVQARQMSPGATFIPSGGAPNAGQMAELERAAAESIAALRALVPAPGTRVSETPAREAPATRPPASPQPGQPARPAEDRVAMGAALRALTPAQQRAAREAAVRVGTPISQSIIDRVRQMPVDEVKMMHALGLFRAGSSALTPDARIRAAARQAGVDEAALRQALGR
jgi:hypothetical protein